MKNFYTSIVLLCALCSSLWSQSNDLLVTFSSVDALVETNEVVEVDVRVSNFSDIVAVQFPVIWDASVFEFESVTNVSTDLPGLSTISFNSIQNGELRMSWFSASTLGLDLPNDHLLFTIRLRATGPLCAASSLLIYDAPGIVVEVLDGNSNLRGLCTNSFAAQVSGPDCNSGNATLSCNDKVIVSLPEEQFVVASADMYLEGGPYNYTTLTIEPEKLTCDDLGITQYTVTDNLTGNSCWGQVQLLDGNGYCDGSGGGNGNGTLVCNDLINVSADPWQCSATLDLDAVLEGGPYDYSTLVLVPTTFDQLNVETQYTVTDTQTGNTCWGRVLLEDKTPPVVVAVQNIVVNLTADPNDPSAGYTAKVYAATIDNGSFDGCSNVTLSPEFVEFDCNNIGDNQVFLTATDEAGNFNSTWTTIRVELKDVDPSNLTCPDDIVIDCETSLDNLAVLGNVQIGNNCSLNYTDFQGYDQNNDGDLDDVYTIDGVDVFEDYNAACGSGSILRSWSTAGFDCEQIIAINNAGATLQESDIVWPQDIDVTCLEPTVFEPTWTASNCALIGFTVESDTFFFESDACLKILNSYTVIDWCAYDPQNMNNPGVFRHVQIVKQIDVESPNLVAENFVLSNCGASQFTASITIDDGDCPSNEFGWSVDLDINDDGVIDNTYEGRTTSEVINVPINETISQPNSQHRLEWTITDLCGNITQITSYFTVSDSNMDNDNPTPYCINLSTALLTNGQVELWAIDFNAGSFDDCTSSDQLRYTFTDTAPTNDSSYNANARSSSKIFTMADADGNGFVQVDVYVWDNAGKSDFCTVNLRLVEQSGNNSDKANFYFTNQNVSAGETVCMPLKVLNFENITGLQGTVSWDNDVVNFSHTQNFGLPGLNDSSFANALEGKLSFVWFDQTGNTPSSLSNNSTLVEICFDAVGQNGESSNIGFSDQPTAFEVSRDASVVEYILTPGSITIGGQSNCVNDNTAPIAVCINNLAVVPTNGQVELFALDINGGSTDNCTSPNDLRYTFSAVNPSNDPTYNALTNTSSNTYTIADANANGEIPVTVYVWDENDNFSNCWATVVLDDQGNCTIEENDIIWPTQYLAFFKPVENNDLSIFEPENLLTLPGITESDVYPSVVQGDCANLAYAYQDVVFPTTNNPDMFFKIIRKWTLLDWLTANIYEYDQILVNYEAGEYICDTLPRSAPVGDCASGHTLEDDVEWPNDIQINDHRISPLELITSSNIDPLDAQPTFYDSTQTYSMTYLDRVGDLTPMTLVIERDWTVTNAGLVGNEWLYTQKITVDLTNFSNLVTANTINNRPIPNVIVDGFNATNMQGRAFTDDQVDPAKDDFARNGLNINDLLLIRSYLVGDIELSELELLAADFNQDGNVSTLDLIELSRVILGLNTTGSTAWTFVDQTTTTESGIDVKAHYIGIKPGDIDDNVILSQSPEEFDFESIYIEDLLISSGKTYSVPLYFGRDIDARGAEIHLEFDENVLRMNGVRSTDAFGEIEWNLEGDNKILILNYNFDGSSKMITTDTPILTLEFEALQNTTLKDVFSISTELQSWIVNDARTLFLIDGIFTGSIGVGVEDLVDVPVAEVYPNPASDILNIKLAKDAIYSDYRFELYDVTGQLLIRSTEQTIPLNHLLNGMYIYKIGLDNKVQTGKLLIKD